MHNFGTQTQKNNNTSFGANLSSTGIQHGNRLQLFVTMSTVTCFILRAHTGTGVSYSQTRINSGEVLEKKHAGEWARRVEIIKDELPGSRRSMHGYLRTCSRLNRHNL